MLSEFEKLEDVLGICCGPTTDVMRHLFKTLKILKYRGDHVSNNSEYHRTYEILDKHLGLNSDNPEPGYIYLYYLHHLGLIDHGCGIRGAWLSSKGHETLNKLENLDYK